MSSDSPSQGQVFRHTIRVPYADVDQMGVVYYANYLVYFEMARNEILRQSGIPYIEMEKGGVMLPVVAAHCDYRLFARYDDLLTVVSHCVAIEGTRLRIEYEVIRDDELLATGYTQHVCMSPGGRILRPPPGLRAIFDSVTRKRMPEEQP